MTYLWCAQRNFDDIGSEKTATESSVITHSRILSVYEGRSM